MRIAKNVEMLEIGGMGGAIYPTLTWDEQRLALIDAGFPGQADAIAQAIADAGFQAGRLTHIIITHQDIDHIGCVRWICSSSPLWQKCWPMRRKRRILTGARFRSNWRRCLSSMTVCPMTARLGATISGKVCQPDHFCRPNAIRRRCPTHMRRY